MKGQPGAGCYNCQGNAQPEEDTERPSAIGGLGWVLEKQRNAPVFNLSHPQSASRKRVSHRHFRSNCLYVIRRNSLCVFYNSSTILQHVLMLRRVAPSDVSERYDVYHAMHSGQPRMCCSPVTLHRFSSCKA